MNRGYDVVEEAKYVMNNKVPLWRKLTLTLEEASEYSGIGICKLRELSNRRDCPFVLWNGVKRHFKRKELEKFLEETYSI